MTIKLESKRYVKCDSCDNTHEAREATSYNARVKAGVDGWTFITEGGKGGPSFDYCPACRLTEQTRTDFQTSKEETT